MALKYLIWQDYYQVRNEKNQNITGVLKIIQDWPICNKNAEDHKRRKGENSNGTHNNSNMNIEVTQIDIAASHT